MRTEDLVFWIEVFGEADRSDCGVLCQRHGDSMVVPRGWTLDDLRDPHLHLFRPPPRPTPPTASVRRRTRTPGHDVEQLAFGGVDEPVPPTQRDDPPDERLDERSRAESSDERTWTPSFDSADDLDGLLAARSPLLSRAFRGAGRHD